MTKLLEPHFSRAENGPMTMGKIKAAWFKEGEENTVELSHVD